MTYQILILKELPDSATEKNIHSPLKMTFHLPINIKSKVNFKKLKERDLILASVDKYNKPLNRIYINLLIIK
jgi:hypothetical protein